MDGMENMPSMAEKQKVFFLLQGLERTQSTLRRSQFRSSENSFSIPVSDEIRSMIHLEEVEVRLWLVSRQVGNVSRWKLILSIVVLLSNDGRTTRGKLLRK